MNNQEETSKGMTPNLPLWSYQLQPDSKLAVRTRKDLEIHLITRALKDEMFKQELLNNPKAVVERELGTKLPEEIEINVLEETETTLYMVLPCNPYDGLSEMELKTSLGMTYEDVAQWVLKLQKNFLMDETNSVTVMARTWRDKEFKQEFLCNPKTFIEKEYGTPIPSKIEIKVFAETAQTLYLALPRNEDDFGLVPANDIPDNEWLNADMGNDRIILIGASGLAGCQVTCRHTSNETRVIDSNRCMCLASPNN